MKPIKRHSLNRTSLKHHTETVHNGGAATTKPSLVSLTCDFPNCDFTAAFPSDLARHTAKHNAAKPISCPACDFACKRKSELTRHHKLKHADTAPLACMQCSYTTKNASHLKRHVRMVHEKSVEEAKTLFVDMDPDNVVVIQMLDYAEEQVVL